MSGRINDRYGRFCRLVRLKSHTTKEIRTGQEVIRWWWLCPVCAWKSVIFYSEREAESHRVDHACDEQRGLEFLERTFVL